MFGLSKLKRLPRPDEPAQNFKMAALEADFLVGEELEELFVLLDGVFLDEDVDFNAEIDSMVKEVADSEENTSGFKCDLCRKVCKSERGLARHQKCKHEKKSELKVSKQTDEHEEMLWKKLHPMKFNSMVNNCAIIVSNDACLVDENIGKKFLSSNESLELWNKIKHIIKEFNGDAEKFYASFYGILVANVLPVKFEDSTLTNILMAEVGNHILLHLSGSKITDLSPLVSTLSENEIKSLQYLSGYIIHKFYTKFQFSKNRESEFNRQCVAILQACKIDSDETQTLVNVRDRGGLWRTNGKIQDVFYQCEIMFRNKTAPFITKLNCGDLVDNMFQNSTILSNFKSICNDIDPKVDKEISLDLLERILILYVRVRAFSYAKDIREKHKVAKEVTKKRPLRTEIKQGSCSLETGH